MKNKIVKTFEEHKEKLNISDVIHSFVVTYRNNYGLNVIIINSENIEIAKKLIEEKTGLTNSLVGGYDIEEIDLFTKGIVFNEGS
jgi:hypothetical protein